MKKKQFIKDTRITHTQICKECGELKPTEVEITDQQWKAFKRLLWYYENTSDTKVSYEANQWYTPLNFDIDKVELHVIFRVADCAGHYWSGISGYTYHIDRDGKIVEHGKI